MSIFLLLPLLLTYTSPVRGTTPISSGFGDFRNNRWHFHHGIDIPKNANDTVYYPGGEDEYYDPEVVSITTMSFNQTNYLIIGRFCFTHLLTRGHPPKPLIIALGITDTSKQNWLHKKHWRDLWKYCKDSSITWRGGLAVGVVAKNHLHFGELLIPNHGRSKNVWINPLWKGQITVKTGKSSYERYGYLEGVNDSYKPSAEMVANLNGQLPGYKIMDSANSNGVWDQASWAGQARKSLGSISTVTEWRKYYYDKAPSSQSNPWVEDSVWCPVVGAGHDTAVEFIGRIYDRVTDTIHRIVPFELRAGIFPWKVQDVLTKYMPMMNGQVFGMPSPAVGYGWEVKKFDTMSDSWFNIEDSVKSFYYETVNFKPSEYSSLVQDGNLVIRKYLPENIGKQSDNTTLRKFYVDFTHGYKELTPYLGTVVENLHANMASSGVNCSGTCGIERYYYPSTAYGTDYSNYYYPDGLYFFKGAFIDADGEFATGNGHFNTTRTAFIIDNIHTPRWFLRPDVAINKQDSTLYGIIRGEATEPFTIRRFYVDTTGGMQILTPMPRDSFISMDMYVVRVDNPSVEVSTICKKCRISEMQPGVYTLEEKDSSYASAHIRIATIKYPCPDKLINNSDSFTVLMVAHLWNYKDLADNTPSPSDIEFESALGVNDTFYGDSAWFYYYQRESNPLPRINISWLFYPLPYTTSLSSVLLQLLHRKFGLSQKVIMVYDAPLPGPYALSNSLIRFVMFDTDSMKVDTLLDVGHGFTPTIAKDEADNMYVAYSRDSSLIAGDTIPLVHPIDGSIMLTTVSPYSGDSAVSTREIYNTTENATMWAMGPVSMVKTGDSLYIAFETFFTRNGKGTHYWVDGITLNLLRYDLITHKVEGPHSIDFVTQEWEFSSPDSLKSVIDSLRSVSITSSGDSVLYLLWTVNVKDTGKIRVYKVKTSEFSDINSNLPYLYEKAYPDYYIGDPYAVSFNGEINGFFTVASNKEFPGWNRIKRIYFQNDSVIHPVIESLYGAWNVNEYRSDGRVLTFTANPEGYSKLFYAPYPYDTLYSLKDYELLTQPSVLRSDDTLFFTYIYGNELFGYEPEIKTTVLTQKIPAYYIETGEPVKDPYTVYRQGYKVYSTTSRNTGKNYFGKLINLLKIRKDREILQTHPHTGPVCYKRTAKNNGVIRVDYGDSLVYEIKYVPGAVYRLYLTGYQQEEKIAIGSVTINNVQRGILPLLKNKENTIIRIITPRMIRNGTIRIKIKKKRANKVYIERIVLIKVTCGKGEIQDNDRSLKFGAELLANISGKGILPVVKLALPEKEKVRIEIYDIQGRRVKEVVNRVFSRGMHTIPIKANNMPSGVYFVNIQGEEKSHSLVKKFIRVN